MTFEEPAHVIRKEHRIECAEIARDDAAVLGAVARELADAVQELIAGSSAAVVVVGVASEWRMLAQSGPEDLSRSWRRLVASLARSTDSSRWRDAFIVAPFASAHLAASILVVPLAGIPLPPRTRRILQPLLDAGGILFDAALQSGIASPRGTLRLVTDARPRDVPEGDPGRPCVPTATDGL